ncbi:lectin-like domain-containing protein [Pseudanabaena sp. PCC 6802]|uniref:lectin-like domain-containing protein n=1 Tax=Pseudanabaena sp. PCC 6802 TaxID=118173 RepID=UPI00034C0398|nr:hypothetical protein [Pseudanabaena sp. PCC 6802]
MNSAYLASQQKTSDRLRKLAQREAEAEEAILPAAYAGYDVASGTSKYQTLGNSVLSGGSLVSNSAPRIGEAIGPVPTQGLFREIWRSRPRPAVQVIKKEEKFVAAGLEGVAQIDKDVIKLIPDIGIQKIGGIVLSNPISLKQWEIAFEFRLFGGTGFEIAGELYYGDGIAITYLPSKDLGGPGEALGLPNPTQGWAVTIDTYPNEPTPHPCLKILNPDNGIIYQSPKIASLRSTNFQSAQVKYNGRQIEARIAGQSFGANVALPTGYYLAIRGATGSFTQKHEIRNPKFNGTPIKPA